MSSQNVFFMNSSPYSGIVPRRFLMDWERSKRRYKNKIFYFWMLLCCHVHEPLSSSRTDPACLISLCSLISASLGFPSNLDWLFNILGVRKFLTDQLSSSQIRRICQCKHASQTWICDYPPIFPLISLKYFKTPYLMNYWRNIFPNAIIFNLHYFFLLLFFLRYFYNFLFLLFLLPHVRGLFQ